MNQSETARDQARKRRIAWLARHAGLTWVEVGKQAGVNAERAAVLFRAFESHLARILDLNQKGFHIRPPEEGVIVGEMYPFKEETRAQAKRRLAAIVRQSYLALDPGECEDCDEDDCPHRVTCPECKIKVCPYCWSHAHAFVASEKHPEAVEKIEQEWNDAEAIYRREEQRKMEERIAAQR